MDKLRFSQQLIGKAVIIPAFLFLFTNCKHDPPISLAEVEVSTSEISFRDQVQPILNSNCAMSGCHDANRPAEDVDLSSYRSILSDDELVVRFNPDKSDLLKEIRGYGRGGEMPPSNRQALDSGQIAILKQWIVEGARNSFWAEGPCDTNFVAFSTHIEPLLNNACNGCHSQSSTGGGILLNSFSLAKASAESGKLLASVAHTGSASPMPKGGNKLSACQIRQIELWISNNYPN